MFDSLAGYPQWFVVACSVVAAIAVLWILVQLVKAAMWILFYAIIVAGVISIVWYFFR